MDATRPRAARGWFSLAPRRSADRHFQPTLRQMLDDRRQTDHGWTWHDFRRSFATALGEAGISEAVADAILNHRQSATRGGVLGVYQRATRWPEQVKAMQLWGQLLAAALNPGEADNKVVPMATRAG